jgi:ElaB/YqjD/DUF883 family membrane-anchored ribosome-binding protein
LERDATGMKARPKGAEAKRHTDARTEAAKARLRSLGAEVDAAIQRPLDAIQQPFSLPGRYPLESLGVALALGLIVGRSPNLARNVVGVVAGRDGKNAQLLMQTLLDTFLKR